MVEDSEEGIEPIGDEPVAAARALNAYQTIILDIFNRYHVAGLEEFEFDRDDIEAAVERTGVKRPKNLGDVIYTFRYRRQLPEPILATQPNGKYWLILGAGDARYRFRLSRLCYVEPTPGLLVRKMHH